MIFGFTMLLLFPIASPSLTDGDREFARANYQRSAAIYDSVLIGTADSANILWRLARVHVCMGDLAADGQKVDLYRKAEKFADLCIRVDSLKSQAYTWRAAALGNIAMFEGGSRKVQLTHIIKRELDKAIALNPADDIAYSILGSFYLALGNVSWLERRLADIFLGSLPEGGYEEAEQALKRAIAIAPNVIRHRYELGLVYMNMDRAQDALGEFLLTLSLPIQLGSDPKTQESARSLIEAIRQD